MELQQVTFPASKGVKDFKSITIREVNGEDELEAAKVAAAKDLQSGGKEKHPVFTELLRRSIVEVNGKPVGGIVPFDEFDSWRVASRNAVSRFYEVLNGLDDDDLKACVAAAMAATEPKSQSSEASTASPNGG